MYAATGKCSINMFFFAKDMNQEWENMSATDLIKCSYVFPGFSGVRSGLKVKLKEFET